MKLELPTMRSMLLAVIAVAISVSQAPAQSLQPGLVVSLTSIDEHFNDIEHLMVASGQGDQAPLVRMMAGEFLKGLDTSKPAGAMVFFNEDGLEPDILAFVGVTSLDDVLDQIAGFLPFVEIDEGGATTTLNIPDGPELSLKQAGGYVFLATNPELLDKAPSDPASSLGGLADKYNFAVKVYGQQIPESLRAQGLQWIRQGYERQIEQLEAMDPLQGQIQRQNFAFSMEQIDNLVNETDELVLGLAIDKQTERIDIDFSMVGLPGSNLAKQSAALGDAPQSKFAGFLVDGSAMSIHGCAKLLGEYGSHYETMISGMKDVILQQMEEEGNLSGDELELVQKLAGDMLDVLNDTVSEGVMDLGAMVNLSDGVEAAMGMRVANGRKLEDGVRTIAEIAAQEAADKVTFNMDASSEGGINYHDIIVQIPEAEEEARKIFGPTLNILLGIGDKEVYVALGQDPKASLRKCLSGSASGKRPVMQYNIRVAPILRFASDLQDDEMMSSMADELSESGGDLIRVVADVVENGQSGSIQFDTGLLKLAGILAEQMGGGFGPQQDF